MTIAIEQSTFSTAADRRIRDEASVRTLPLQPGASMSEYLLASSPAALCLIDQHNRFMLVNEAMASIVGEPADTLIGCLATNLFPLAGDTLALCHQLAREGKPLPCPEVAWRGRYYQLCFNPLAGPDGAVQGLSVAAIDRSHRARVEQRVRESRQRLIAIARQDHLTGLLNRRGLDIKLGLELRRSRRTGAPLGLLVIDIDCFKAFNDEFGHGAGDDCLRAVAAAIRACLRRPADFAGRYGGEEFLLALPDTDEEGAATVAENCRRAVESLGIVHPVSPHGRVTVSIGVSAIAPEMAISPAGVIDAADRALYRAKDEGRNRVSVWNYRRLRQDGDPNLYPADDNTRSKIFA